MKATREDWERLFSTWPGKLCSGYAINHNGECCTLGHMGRTQGLSDEDIMSHKLNGNYELINEFWLDGIPRGYKESNLSVLISSENDSYSPYETMYTRSTRMLEYMFEFFADRVEKTLE